MELSAGEELDDDDDCGEEEEDAKAALDDGTQSNRELLEQSMPLELFLSATTTSALELEASGSPELSLNGSDLLEEEENDNDRPLVLFILSDDGT